MGRVVTEVLEDAKRLGARARRGRDGVVLGKRAGRRLLQRDVLAGRQCGDRVLGMHVMRGEDVDRIDVRVLEQAAVVAVDALGRPLGRTARREREVAVADGDNTRARVLEVTETLEIGDAAAADDADANVSPFHQPS
jgi:hypothetical protein